jgi:hypothetical protein
MLSIAVSTWKATKYIMQYSTVVLVESMNRLVISARKPPNVYMLAIMNG